MNVCMYETAKGHNQMGILCSECGELEYAMFGNPVEFHFHREHVVAGTGAAHRRGEGMVV